MRISCFLSVLLLLAAPEFCQAAQRISILPSFSDLEVKDDSRKWLAAFDARVQADLLTGWNCEVLSRSGLSAVVFEQKLAAAEDPDQAPPLVLPAEAVVISVLDSRRKQLRLHVTRVDEGMKLSAPKVFQYKDVRELSGTLPQAAADYLAKIAKLQTRETLEKPAGKLSEKITCALLDPISAQGGDENLNALSGIFRASLEQELTSMENPVELVERSRITTLLDEATLSASGMVGANASASIGRLAGADLILTPFVNVISETELQSVLFAVDVKSGRILSARAWEGAPLDPPPANILREGLAQAFRSLPEGGEALADNPAMRHAESAFITGLRDSFGGLRQSVATEAELALNLADASLALAHDDAELMRAAITKLGSKAVPEPITQLEEKLYPNRYGLAETLALMKSGRLAELHDQARRILGLASVEIQETDWDLLRLARYHIRLGEPERASSLLENRVPDRDELVANDALYQPYAEALFAAGKYAECIDFIKKRGRFSSNVKNILLDSLHATGQFEEEFRIMWVNRKSSMKTAPVDQLVRFLDLAAGHGQPAESLVAFSRYANSWRKNDPALRLPFIRLRIAAGEKERAVSDAQCMWLASRRDGRKDIMQELGTLLEGLGAKPIEGLPAASGFLKFPQGTRIDMIHDQTIDSEVAAKVAQETADFWGCEVHVVRCELDATRLASYNTLNKSIEGRDFARGIVHFKERPGNLLQTVFLTNQKLRSTQRNHTGDIYAVTSLGNSVRIISTYYFRNMKGSDSRPLERSTAIAVADIPVVRLGIHAAFRKTDPQGEYFFTFNPDMMSANGNLHMRDHMLGIAPSTGKILESRAPLDFLKLAAKLRGTDQRKEAENPAPDAEYFREVSPVLAATKPVIIRPRKSN